MIQKMEEILNWLSTAAAQKLVPAVLILVGGLLEFKEEVDAAIEAGATAVSTADRILWDYK